MLTIDLRYNFVDNLIKLALQQTSLKEILERNIPKF